MSEDLMQSTLEEQTFWCDCVRGLPGLEGFSGTGYDKFGERIIWGTGSHSVKAFRETFDIVKPKYVFEIGSNIFYATAVFLELAPESKIITCDISQKDETIVGAKIMSERYGDRFKYFDRHLESDTVIEPNMDLCFVDGSHFKHDVHKDIELCLSLKSKYFLMDDILPQFGGTQEAIDEFKELELVKTWGNIALYRNTSL